MLLDLLLVLRGLLLVFALAPEPGGPAVLFNILNKPPNKPPPPLLLAALPLDERSLLLLPLPPELPDGLPGFGEWCSGCGTS